MAATAFGTLYAVAVPVHAACTEVTSNQIVCVGDVTNATNGVLFVNTDTGPTSVTADGTITGTTGYGIYVINNNINTTSLTINAVTVTGGGSGIVTTNSGTGNNSITATGEVTGGSDGIFGLNGSAATDLIINAVTVTGGTGSGIYAGNNGSGVTRITATGTVMATDGIGIIALTNVTATDLIIDAVTVIGRGGGYSLSESGIYAVNHGTGVTSITTSGDVTSGGYGIYAKNDINAKDLTINAATVTGGNDGIRVVNNGIGATTITASDTVTGTSGYGIYASGSGTDLSINAVTVTGGVNGINAYNTGIGMTSITTTGDVTGSSGSGVSAVNSGLAADLTITVESGSVSGGEAGIMAEHEGSGNNTVVLAGGTSIQGGTEAGVVMITDSGNQFLNTVAEISSLNDIALSSTNTGGSTVVNNAGVMTGIINMTGTDITFNNEAAGVLSMRDFSSGSKADPVSNFGGSAVFNNAGTIRFDAANNDGTLTHGTLSGIATFNHSGTIDLGTNGPAGNTLTIAGQFVSNGGSVYLNTLLDDASSNGGIGTSDRLILTDVTTGSGATKLYIQATSGSLGALTTGNGIQVVEVQGTSSSDAFVLGKPVTAGLYQYVLYQGTDQNWYLSSYAVEDGGEQPQQTERNYNASLGAYLGNQTAATTLFMHTLYDRQGHINNPAGSEHSSAWVRVVTRHGSNESVGGRMKTRTDQDLIHLGVDIGKWQMKDGNLHVGVMGAYGQSKARTTSQQTGMQAKGTLDGYSLGVYGTWFTDEAWGNGLYVDGWLQYSWFKNKVTSDSYVRGEEKYDSRLWTISAEAGYGFLLGKTANTEIMLTPQVQLAYNYYDADDHTDRNDNLRVSGDKASGVVTRVGARLYGRSLSVFTARPYLEANWVYSSAKNELNFGGEVLKDEVPKNRLEAKLGIQGTIAKNWTAWGQAGVQWGKDSYHRYEGQFGLKYQW